MSTEQWAACDEVVVDMRVLAGMLLNYDLDDPFQHLLRIWAVYLTILGWEMLESVLILTRAGKRRAAFGLSRTLIEYAARMGYYYLEAEKVAGPWRDSGKLGPADMRITETPAYVDWSTASAKMRSYMKKMPDLSFITATAQRRADVEKEISETEKLAIRQWARMRNVAEADDDIRNELTDVEYAMRCGYLHGDQGALYEVCNMYAERRYGEPSFTAQFSDRRVVGYAAYYALKLMSAIEDAVGRQYAVTVLKQKLDRLFEPAKLKRGRISVRRSVRGSVPAGASAVLAGLWRPQ